MVWVVDDLAEAALGPWGLAVGLGVGVIAAVQRRRAKAAAATEGAPATATAWAAGGFGSVMAVTDGVKERIQSTLAEAGDSWRDLYAEAHHEWQQSRAGGTGTILTSAAAPAAAAAPTVLVANASGVPINTGKRVRGPNGRYLRLDEQGSIDTTPSTES
jgi:hypothetical protein